MQSRSASSSGKKATKKGAVDPPLFYFRQPFRHAAFLVSASPSTPVPASRALPRTRAAPPTSASPLICQIRQPCHSERKPFILQLVIAVLCLTLTLHVLPLRVEYLF